MPRLPFFGFPFQYPYNNYYRNPIHNADKNNSINSDDKINESNSKQSRHRQPFSFDFNGFSDNSRPVAELLGIDLYIDDIIILCLLFILYKEEVKDEMLFICLLLLLLT